jgi:endonuclease/exonuclease/phosphatase family metal-dependent hydrolase
MRRIAILTFVFIFCFALTASPQAQPQAKSMAQSLSNGKGDLRVMTYNVNEGTDYKEVMAAHTPLEFLLAVGATITQVRFTEPNARMQALASQIIAANADLVSLQELDQWSTGSLNPATGQCGAVSTEFDMLPELMNALEAQGGHYTIANQAQNWFIRPTPGLIPPATFLCVQVIDTIAILARTDLGSKLQVTNPQTSPFEHILNFATPFGSVPFSRGWVSVDVSFNDRTFRFIGTHLESVDADIRRQQGEETRLGPANTSLPVIIAMDSNSQAFPDPKGATYMDFMTSGFRDVWSETRPAVPGLTCCQAQLDNNVESELSQRIDLLLTFGPIEGQRAALFGATQASKTPTGFWPSDHAGVAAQVVVEEE